MFSILLRKGFFPQISGRILICINAKAIIDFLFKLSFSTFIKDHQGRFEAKAAWKTEKWIQHRKATNEVLGNLTLTL